MKTRILLSIVLSSFAGINAFAGDNLLTNGDFEIFETKAEVVTEGWADASTNNELEKVNVINGTKSIRFTGVNTGSWLTRIVDVEAGATYTFSFTGRIHDAAGPSGTETTKVGILTGRIKSHPEGEWVTLMTTQSNVDTAMSETFTVPDSVTQIKVQVFKNKKIAYADDLSLVKMEASAILKTEAPKLKTYSLQNGLIKIQCDEQIKNYTVYAISGSLAQQNRVNANEIVIENLAQGIYLIKLELNTGKPITRKIIVY